MEEADLHLQTVHWSYCMLYGHYFCTYQHQYNKE